jgi:DNA-binding FadR family transcriptional regulator
MVTEIRRLPLAEQAASAIVAGIRSGEWQLGHKLPGETTLAAELGVGRSTIREAIRELAGKGVLESRQGAGVFVTALEPREDWDDVLRRAGIVSVIEARIAIEAEAASLAAERRTRSDIADMRRCLSVRAEHSGDVEALVDADAAFHRAIVHAAHNELLSELFDGFMPRTRTAMIDMLRLKPDDDAQSDHASHGDLLDAIVDKSPQRAAAASRSHLMRLRSELTSTRQRPKP